MNEAVRIAEQTLRDLEQRRLKLAARVDKIGEERKAIGYQVFADGDTKDRKRLDELNLESAKLSGELEAISAAVEEATRRLNSTKAAEARVADETKAKALLELADEFDAQVRKLSDAGDALVAACNAISALHTKTYSLNAQRPTRQQLDVLLGRVIATMIMKSGLQHQAGTTFLAPDERRAATDLSQYADIIRADANARIDEKREAA
jgi:hypothetical protein